MNIFQCDHCGQPVYFDNHHCGACGAGLGFFPADFRFRQVNGPPTDVKLCANRDQGGCNWLLAADDPNDFCISCRLNQTIPPLGDESNLKAWRQLESAKRRLVYSLLRLGLPVQSKAEAPETGLAFRFLSEDAPTPDDEPVLTGHADGIITINIAEADPVRREHARSKMGEPYRTLIGHFRHEAGHYYWERLIAGNPDTLSGFRNLFGDERTDYAAALDNHYAQGPAPNWSAQYLSAYASSHPWEDWAETWAHYLHLLDTLETAHAFGMRLEPPRPNAGALSMHAASDPYLGMTLEEILAQALPLTLAVNSLNRGMGQPDIYPFVLPPPVVSKLSWIHDLIQSRG